MARPTSDPKESPSPTTRALSSAKKPGKPRLPSGFERATAPDGRPYYIDHYTKSTLWNPPEPAPVPTPEAKRLHGRYRAAVKRCRALNVKFNDEAARKRLKEATGLKKECLAEARKALEEQCRNAQLDANDKRRRYVAELAKHGIKL